MKELDGKVVDFIARKLRISPKTVKKDIYNMVKNYPRATKNAVAQIYATKKGLSVFRKLDKDDKASLPSIEVTHEKIKIKQKIHNKKIITKTLVNYDTDDYFIKGHIDELHRAYNARCYTAVFVLARKIIENLIIDILRKKFPENKKNNKELYFDINKKRFYDFEVILKNLYKKKDIFGSDNKAVESLYQKAMRFKKDSNDKAHSWFHLVKNDKEIDNLDIQSIIEIIKRLEKTVGIRK